VIRMMLNNDTLDRYVSTALSVVDFAIHKFPSRLDWSTQRQGAARIVTR
jgi:hypothetical protein